MMNLAKVFLLCSIVGILLTCKEDKSKEIEAFAGKYIDRINKYEVIAEDGTSFKIDDSNLDRIYYLIRHAEKDTLNSDDPVLSFQGELRSTKLAEMLWNTKLDAVYSTMTTRTLFTVDSIADTRNIQIKPYDIKKMREMVNGIRADKKLKHVLIVGHSNTTPVLANHLYGTDFFKKSFDEKDYDNFVIVMEKTDSTKAILPLKYKHY